MLADTPSASGRKFFRRRVDLRAARSTMVQEEFGGAGRAPGIERSRVVDKALARPAGAVENDSWMAARRGRL
jgi:hypothetical protein